MGCFSACFGKSKDEKRLNQRKHKVLTRQQSYGNSNSLQYHAPERVTSAEPLGLNTDLPKGIEEESSLIVGEKVNLDKNTDLSEGIKEELALIASEKVNLDKNVDLPDGVEELSLVTRKKVTFNTNVKTYEPASVHGSLEFVSKAEDNVENQRDSSEESSLLSDSHLEDDSITSSVRSYPPNHRYQNCRESDDEAEEFDCADSDLDDENDDIGEYSDCDEDDSENLGQNVWSKSVPAASMESSTKISSVLAAAEEVDSPLIFADKEGHGMSFNHYARDRSRNVSPVLNPVENISQWKTVKSKATPKLKPQKENFTTNQEESRLSFSFMSKSDHPAHENQEISVDASLSSWLSSSKSTPVKKTSRNAIETEGSYSGSNSVKSLIEDRPILGALTVEEIKQFSASNSPRKSPSRSPDEMPIIGSVGRYWNSPGSAEEIKRFSASNSPRKSPSRSPDEMPIIGNVGRYWNSSRAEDSSSISSYKGIPNTTSKYSEDKKVTWHSTPFETRLERALKRGDIET